MRLEITVPEVEGVTEAFVVEWLVEVGSAIAIGDDVVEVVTDKANIAIQAEVAGTVVELCADPEERVEPGQVLAVLEGADP